MSIVRSNRITVDVIVHDGFKALEAIGPMSVLSYANRHLRRRGCGGVYDVQVSATHVGNIASDTGMSLCASRRIDRLALPHTAIVVGSPHIEEALISAPEIVDWLEAVSAKLTRTVALCTGTFFLAAAGLLDGRRATTHWALARDLESRYPGILVEADSIFVKDGTLWTSAGVTAGIDLTLALVEEDFGPDVALDVARDLVVYLKRPGGQSQFSMHLLRHGTRHEGMRALQDWILSNLHRPIDSAEMAARVSMSARNFTRTFRRETGATPASFVRQARLEEARRMLEQSDFPAKTISSRVGFGSYEAMRKAFVETLGVTPSAYRERFGSSAARRAGAAQQLMR
ncbi:HTH-type transcriptional regulator CdhR [Paraburkholderia domus]|nr:GlxA family transcriptional regulator [Burkholderia sp. R-70006]CAE6754148.1 HTH-type transcriptional regulator CdhR [Paraburkholderia domus]